MPIIVQRSRQSEYRIRVVQGPACSDMHCSVFTLSQPSRNGKPLVPNPLPLSPVAAGPDCFSHYVKPPAESDFRDLATIIRGQNGPNTCNSSGVSQGIASHRIAPTVLQSKGAGDILRHLVRSCSRPAGLTGVRSQRRQFMEQSEGPGGKVVCRIDGYGRGIGIRQRASAQ